MYSTSSDPSLVKNPRRSSAIYMYVTESMIKFLPFSFLKQSAKPLHIHTEYYYIFTSFCKVHYSAGEWLLYLQNLNTCADCAIILLVQFHHINDREGRGVCVSVVLKFYWSNLIQTWRCSLHAVQLYRWIVWELRK